MSLSTSEQALVGSPTGAGPRQRAVVRGPASLSNLGPGFDTLGLAITGWGDRVTAARTDAPGVAVTVACPDGVVIPLEPARNTAAVAASAVWAAFGGEGGLALHIEKGIPLGSGIGGSAASAVAGALAANALVPAPQSKAALVEAVLAGEAVASGSRHGDNVLPALFGGLVLVSADDPTHYHPIPLPAPLHLAVVVPALTVLTSEARAILPPEVPLRDAVRNASALAFLLEALRAGDLAAAGRLMMTDRLVEPVRARLVACYDAVRRAALAAGAHGCALTGSGPAMFALADTPVDAARIADAMQAACRAQGIDAVAHAAASLADGAQLEEES